MGQFVNQLVNYGRYGLELLFGVFVLSIGLRKTNRFWLKFGIFLGISVVLSTISAYISIPLIESEKYRRTLSYAFFLILTLPSIFAECLSYKTTAANKTYVIIAAVLSRNISRTLYNTVLFVIGEWILGRPEFWQYGDRGFATLPIYYLVFAGVLILLSFVTRKVFRHPRFKTLSWGVMVLLPLAVLLNLFIALLENGTMYTNSSLFIASCLTDVISTSGFLFTVTLMTLMSLQELQRAEDREQFNSRIKQYETISESIELINHKCHDLRHQLRAAKLSGGVDSNFIDDVVKSIDIYDHRVDTGNKDLDMLLMDFKFRASSQNIETIIIADGTSVSFLERQDLISLFSNMLENALNYVKLFEKKEDRFVSLKVYKKDGFVFIDCENPYSDGVEDNPKDKRYHGFGVPSMKRIAKKYEGALTVSKEDGLFTLTVTFIS